MGFIPVSSEIATPIVFAVEGTLIFIAVVLAVSLIAALAVIWRMQRTSRDFRTQMQSILGSATASDTGLLNGAARLAANQEDSELLNEQMTDALVRSPIGIVLVDAAGTEVFANPAADAYMTGRAGDAVIGIRIREVLNQVRETGEPHQQEVDVFTPSARTIMLRATPLVQGERTIGAVAFTDDLTPRSRIDAIRRDFVANASHELKTPLGALRLLAEALVATRNPEVQADLSERIQSEAARMTRLVEDILDLSLIEEHPSVRGVVDVCDVIREAVKQVSLTSEALAVPVESTCEPIEVLGDRRRLVSAIANLVENAITYTSVKGIDQAEPVQVRGFRDGATACIEVEDHGIGIPERHRDRIFERFYRVDQGRSRASGGTGLGLAIVRHVVQNHWGEVVVESIPGKGSTFRVRLPAREE